MIGVGKVVVAVSVVLAVVAGMVWTREEQTGEFERWRSEQRKHYGSES